MDTLNNTINTIPFHMKTWKHLAFKILSENGTPMHYSDITKKAMDFKETKAKNPHRIVWVELHRDKRLIKIGRGIFALKKWSKNTNVSE